MHFWDYGNAFLLEASRAGNAMLMFTGLYYIRDMTGAQVVKPGGAFMYPSYVQDIMGWVC